MVNHREMQCHNLLICIWVTYTMSDISKLNSLMRMIYLKNTRRAELSTTIVVHISFSYLYFSENILLQEIPARVISESIRCERVNSPCVFSSSNA